MAAGGGTKEAAGKLTFVFFVRVVRVVWPVVVCGDWCVFFQLRVIEI